MFFTSRNKHVASVFEAKSKKAAMSYVHVCVFLIISNGYVLNIFTYKAVSMI